MDSRPVRRITIVALMVFPAAASTAQDIPVRSWVVPAPEAAKQSAGAATVFSPIDPPCRLYDSRSADGPIPGSSTRNFDFVPGGSPSCGALPAEVAALSLFFTVVAPQGPGFIFAWPGPTPPGSPTSIVNYTGTPGEIRNNAAIVPVAIGGSGAFNVTAGVSGTELIIDLNGIFSNRQPFTLQLNGNFPAAITGANFGTSGSPGSVLIGIRGIAEDPDSQALGVRGESDSPVTNSAVLGTNFSNTGRGFGVIGDNGSDGDGSAGVFGRSGSSNITFPYSQTIGVLGTSNNGGNPTGNIGVAGTAEGPDASPLFGVYGSIRFANGEVRSGALAHLAFGVYSFGDIGAVGTKSFVEPHPTDPGLEIAYVSLEGNEAGTYFRGRGRFQNGLARIAVPEDFRLVSEADGLSIQVTPIGEMASFAVVRIGLDEIVVKASRNVEFFYTVNGVRKNHAGFRPIRKNTNFVPHSPGDTMRDWSTWVKQRLIDNGTLTPEGTPNLETAERLGWKAAWEKHAAEAAETRERAAANPEKTPE